jgi:hypothetical protein
VSDVDVIALPEGEAEAGKQKERLTSERLDQLAVFFATPDQVIAGWTGPKDFRDLALLVGCRVASIPRWKKHPSMVKRVGELLTAAAVYAMPNILYAQMGLANDGDTKAANFVATVGKFIRSGGLTVHNTQVSPVSEVEKPMSDEQLSTKLDAYFESKSDAE